MPHRKIHVGLLFGLSVFLTDASTQAAFVDGIETFGGTVLDTTTWEPCTNSPHRGTINQNGALLLTARADCTTRSLKAGIGDRVGVDIVAGQASSAGLYFTTNSAGDSAVTFYDSGFVFIEFNRLNQFSMGHGSSGGAGSNTMGSYSAGEDSKTFRLTLERLGPTSVYGAVYDGDTIRGSLAYSFKGSGRLPTGLPNDLPISLVSMFNFTGYPGPGLYDNVTFTPRSWQGQIDQCYAPTANIGRVGVTSTQRVAQVFTVARSGILTHVDLQLDRHSTLPDDGLTLDIRPVVGGVPVSDDAAALSSAVIAADRIVKSPTGDLTGVDLPGGLAVNAGDVLAIVAHTHAANVSVPFSWSGGDMLYTGGDGYQTTSSGAFIPSTRDYGFQVFIAEVPEPSACVLLTGGALGLLWRLRWRRRSGSD